MATNPYFCLSLGDSVCPPANQSPRDKKGCMHLVAKRVAPGSRTSHLVSPLHASWAVVMQCEGCNVCWKMCRICPVATLKVITQNRTEKSHHKSFHSVPLDGQETADASVDNSPCPLSGLLCLITNPVEPLNLSNHSHLPFIGRFVEGMSKLILPPINNPTSIK